MRVRTDPPAMRWMRVSLSPITIAQPCLQSLALKLSSLFLSLFLQLCSPHPCPGEINPRRCRSVESKERLVQLAAPSTQPAPRQAARRTLPHTLHRSPGPATPNFDFVCSPGLQCQFPPDQFCRQFPKVRQENVLNR